MRPESFFFRAGTCRTSIGTEGSDKIPGTRRRADAVDRVFETRFPGLAFSHSIGCDQSPVAMRVSARLSRIKFTFLPNRSATSWATDGEYFFRAEFFSHALMMHHNQCARMVNLGQSSRIESAVFARPRNVPALASAGQPVQF